MKNTYIYFLEENGIVFYIGKTKNKEQRLKNHRSLYGKYTQMVEVDFVCDYESRFWEIFYIQLYKMYGFSLKNKVYLSKIKNTNESIKKNQNIKYSINHLKSIHNTIINR